MALHNRSVSYSSSSLLPQVPQLQLDTSQISQQELLEKIYSSIEMSRRLNMLTLVRSQISPLVPMEVSDVVQYSSTDRSRNLLDLSSSSRTSAPCSTPALPLQIPKLQNFKLPDSNSNSNNNDKLDCNPSDIGTVYFNHASGKKRVQCNACLRTYCDKGALKIHFSGKHLNKKYRCTVEGCVVTFSSARSRNRHSANGNAKLHSPFSRRKITKYDGRSTRNATHLTPIQFNNVIEKKIDNSTESSTKQQFNVLQNNTDFNTTTTTCGENKIIDQSQKNIKLSQDDNNILNIKNVLQQKILANFLKSPALADNELKNLTTSNLNPTMPGTIDLSLISKENQNKNIDNYYYCNNFDSSKNEHVFNNNLTAFESDASKFLDFMFRTSLSNLVLYAIQQNVQNAFLR